MSSFLFAISISNSFLYVFLSNHFGINFLILESIEDQKRLNDYGLITSLQQRKLQGCNNKVWDLLICHNMPVCDIGNLFELYEDYYEQNIDLNKINFTEFAHRELSSFFNGWDFPEIPFWITGLILGYPIENTISIYKENLNLNKHKKVKV